MLYQIILLELPQLAVPQSGELQPEDISVSKYKLRLSDSGVLPDRWMDEDIEGTEYRILRGRDGLVALAQLFFSEYTQLGFLNAVFKAEAGIDGLVAIQSYSVYKEVRNVAFAVAKLRKVKAFGGGVLSASNPAVVEMKAALDELDKWASKQPGYPGLRKYHEEMCLELCDDAERLAAIRRFCSRLRPAMDDVSRMETLFDRYWKEGSFRQDIRIHDRYKVEDCKKLAEEVISLPVLDNPSYGEAVKCSIEAVRRAAYVLGMQRGVESVQSNESAKKALEVELNRVKYESDRKSQEIKALKDMVAEKSKQLKDREKEIERLNLKSNVKKLDKNMSGLGVSVQASKPRKRRRWYWLENECLEWGLMAVTVVFLALFVFYLWRILPIGCSKGKKLPNGPIAQTETNKLLRADVPIKALDHPQIGTNKNSSVKAKSKTGEVRGDDMESKK